jgi:hypothetical protein
MISQNTKKLIQRLADATSQRRLEWESMGDADAFSLAFPAHYIRLYRDHDEEPLIKVSDGVVVFLVVVDVTEAVIERVSSNDLIDDGEAHLGKLLYNMYGDARSIAVGAESSLEELLTQLNIKLS